VRRHDDGPGAIAWLVAFVSLVLPWAGIGLGLFGAWQLSKGERSGWLMLGIGGALIILDVLIDFVWAHPTVSLSDQPELNRRATQLIGRVLVVEEPIEGGRGKVRVGDTLWPVEGPDAPVGTEVKVTAAKATVLLVERR
jgi:inner membrane protein